MATASIGWFQNFKMEHEHRANNSVHNATSPSRSSVNCMSRRRNNHNKNKIETILQEKKKKTGNEAALELWDLIHSSSSTSTSTSSSSSHRNEPVVEHFESNEPHNNDSESEPEPLGILSFHRFEKMQRDRTLHHASLIQPSKSEEEIHLKRLNSNATTHTSTSSSSFSSLEERLACALEKAGLGSSTSNLASVGVVVKDDDCVVNGKGKGKGSPDECEMPSPTSTLQFPVQQHESSRHTSMKNLMQLQSDYFVEDTSAAAGVQKEEDEIADDVFFISDDYYDEVEEYHMPLNDVSPILAPKVSSTNHNKHHNKKSELNQHSATHTFVVCADTQFGMLNHNQDWTQEMEYAKEAVKEINKLEPKPKFVCVCGDLIDMEQSFYHNKKKKEKASQSSQNKKKFPSPPPEFSLDQCHEIQQKQQNDFKQIFSQVDQTIPLVCLCGNHDVGNRPNKASIERYTNAFGDDYLAFWTNKTYNIVLNTNLFADPSEAQDLFDTQLIWLEQRLQYGQKHKANHIFVFGHHPWFLYHEEEDDLSLKGISPYPQEWGSNPDPNAGFPDYYFHVPLQYRQKALKLFQQYKVSACFSGHFHQNLIAKTSFGMDMIVTAPLSMTFQSTGIDQNKRKEWFANQRGMRVVKVKKDGFEHYFQTI